ncbi:MAG: thiamine phosphate synthase, partial [Pirellulales bacterium]|nr:thiamine phosphate synthase [Pirellulales bacterium]
SVQEAQSMVGLEKRVGRTTHSAIEATDEQRYRAAYIGVGPCYPSETKPFSHFATAELLSQVANNLSIPVFAIGGMKIDHLESIFATGISRVAVASAITRSSDPAAAAKEFLARLSRNRERLANVNRSGAF